VLVSVDSARKGSIWEKLEAGLKGAGVPNRPNTQTKEGGTVFDVSTSKGTMPVRVMPGSAKNPPRVVMGTKGSPQTPDGTRDHKVKRRTKAISP